MFQEIAPLFELARNELQSEPNKDFVDGIDVGYELVALINSESWSNDQRNFLKCWMKKLDVATKHYTEYQHDWKPGKVKKTVSERIYQSTVLLITQYLYDIKDEGNTALILKVCNVLFKVLDRVDSVFGRKKSEVVALLTTIMSQQHPCLQSASQSIAVCQLKKNVLPITVLFSEGPIARAYLETIKSMGLKVEKIIQLISVNDLVSKKPVGRFLPTAMRLGYAARKQYNQMFYWPEQIKNKYKKQVTAVRAQIESKLDFSMSIQLAAMMPVSLHEYTPQVDQLMVNGLSDPVLENKLAAEASELFLYTGGGIVPEGLLNLANKKFIHIHPGFLPDIRGADCVLWSQLIANTCSATAFFLAPGIDIGDVILPCWLPQVKLDFSGLNDLNMIYRLIYGFFDPWVRAYVLRQLVYMTKGLQCIDSDMQQESEGMTFHFMHDSLKQLAFKQLAKVI